MQTIFLTGAAGFIGSHLVPELLQRGHAVTGFDNLSTGRKADIEPYLEHPNFRFFEGDLRDSVAVQYYLRGHDMVWHLGANTLIPPGSSDFMLDFSNNTLATMELLESMRKLGIKDIVFASTAAVYGDEPGAVFSEEFGPLHPISLYGASKLACESFISAYSALYGIYASIFRFSNVVGGGMGHGVTYDFIQKLRKDPTRLPIWGDGKGRKPYFLVEDCIRGMIHAHGLPAHSRLLCETFNLGADTLTAVDEVAMIVCEEMGLKHVKLVHEGGRHGFPGDVPEVLYNTEKIRHYGWAPSLNSSDAVRFAARRIIDGKP